MNNDREPQSRKSRVGYDVPSFSIVTPSYNQGQFIEETIISVLSQDYPNFEYIIIDGGSTDNTHNVLEKYKDQINKIIIEPDNGPADAIQKGWNISGGDILAYLNSDDIYLPGSLQKVADIFSQGKNVDVICGNELKINSNGNVLGKSSIAAADYISLLSLCFIPQPSVFVRKGLVDKVGGINPEMKLIFDFDLWVRIARKHTINCIPDLLAATRLHENTITSRRRVDIVKELDYVVRREILSNSCVVPFSKRRFILGKLYRFLMRVAHEADEPLLSFKYAVKSMSYLPTYKNLSKVFLKQIKYLNSMSQLNSEEKIIINEKSMIHWSSYCSK